MRGCPIKRFFAVLVVVAAACAAVVPTAPGFVLEPGHPHWAGSFPRVSVYLVAKSQRYALRKGMAAWNASGARIRFVNSRRKASADITIVAREDHHPTSGFCPAAGCTSYRYGGGARYMSSATIYVPVLHVGSGDPSARQCRLEFSRLMVHEL